MIWTNELASFLEDAPWPANKDELIDYCFTVGTPSQVIDNLNELEDSYVSYESIDDIWSDSSSDSAIDDFFYGDDNF